MSGIRINGLLTKEELDAEYARREKSLWSDRKFFLFRNFLFFYLSYWIGYFCYWFCQDSLRYYIKHFKLEVQLPIIICMIASAIFWILLVRVLISQCKKRDNLNDWYNRQVKLHNLALKLETMDITRVFNLGDGKVITLNADDLDSLGNSEIMDDVTLSKYITLLTEQNTLLLEILEILRN
jgi:hypothetical protein